MTTSIPQGGQPLSDEQDQSERKAAARQHAYETVERSGTSFASGMKILPEERRNGMYAVYAFCREVDDIADDEGISVADRQKGLDAWRVEIDNLFEGKPQTLTGMALLDPVRTYNLAKEEFLLVIEGMEMDAHGPVIAPTMDRFLAYTRRAAGAVGMLSMPVFGAPQNKTADEFALALGDALQITNILRDIAEDAELGRLYLPRELLEKYNVPLDPKHVIGAEGLPMVGKELGNLVREKFRQARVNLQSLDWRVMRPALLMMGIYEGYFKKLEARGWDRIGEPLTMSKVEKILISLRYAIAPPLNVER